MLSIGIDKQISKQAYSLFLDGSGLLLFDGLDDTDSNGLLHVSNGESSEWWVLRESFNTHWLVGDEGNHGAITRLDTLWFLFKDGTGSSVDLFLDFLELAGNVSSVAIEDWAVSVTDGTRMVQDDDLSVETGGFLLVDRSWHHRRRYLF